MATQELDVASARRRARAVNLGDPERQRLLELTDLKVRQALFARRDLTAAEGRKHFSGETRVSVLMAGATDARPWKIRFLIAKAVELRSVTLAERLLGLRQLKAPDLSVLVGLLDELGVARSEKRHGRLLHLDNQRDAWDRRTRLWATTGSEGSGVLVGMYGRLSAEDAATFTSDLLALNAYDRLATLAEEHLEPTNVVRQLTSDRCDHVILLAEAISRIEITRAGRHGRAIELGLNNYRALTIAGHWGRLIPPGPILHAVDRADVPKLARVVADPNVTPSRAEMVHLACNANHDDMTALHLAQRLIGHPAVVDLLPRIDAINTLVIEAMSGYRDFGLSATAALDALGPDRLGEALQNSVFWSRKMLRGTRRPLLPDGPILDWLAADGWTADVERVALALPIDALKERGYAAGQWFDRNLGSRGDLQAMFEKMLPDWTGTIGELLEVIEAI